MKYELNNISYNLKSLNQQ